MMFLASRPLHVALLTLTAGLAIAVAQQGSAPPQPPAGDQQPPVFRTGTNLVRVDVTVTDRSGAPIRTLTQEDFEVREDDRPQTITSFRLVEANGEPTDAFSLPIRSPEHAAAEAAREDVRVFVIFWDEYHIGEFQSATLARQALTRFVLDAFGPTDLVAIVDPLTPLDAVRFTRDRRALAEQVHRLRGRRGVYVPPRSLVEEEHLRARIPVERLRSQVATSALKAMVMHLGALREGRKSLIFVGESLGPIPRSEVDVLSDIVRTANHNNTAIYTFDPRGLQAGGGRTSPVLSVIAEGSGADAYANNDMLSALKGVVRRASAYYLLGYTPADTALDGRFRRISVKVRGTNLDVDARSGYWQVRAEDMARAREAAAAAVLPAEIAAANRQLTPENSHRPIELWTGFRMDGSGTPLVTVAWDARPGFSGEARPDTLEVEGTLDGRVVFKGTSQAEDVTFPASPGTLQLVTLARNAAGEIIDRDRRTLVIPADDVALALGTPVVLRARNAREVRALDEGPAGAAATRDFDRTDRLRVRVEPYGRAAAGATISATLLNARGTRLATLPMRPAGDARHHVLDLPLSAVAPGDFIIRIDAASGAAKADAHVAFRLVR